MVRIRSEPRTQAYVMRRTAQGMSNKEILRCLKRYIVRELYPLILADLSDAATVTWHKSVNAVVERFFGSLKHDWILKVAQPTREHMKQDVANYIRYYNNDRLHTANSGMSPVKYEMSLIKVSG